MNLNLINKEVTQIFKDILEKYLITNVDMEMDFSERAPLLMRVSKRLGIRSINDENIEPKARSKKLFCCCLPNN